MNQTHHHKTEEGSKRRLGEILLTKKVLTVKQLEEAVEYQCLYGGKLGTTLIELGLASEDQMAKALSQQLSLHYIKPDLLMNIPASTLKLIPTETALKYKIVPYYKDGKKLFVALQELKDLKLLDQLSFQLSHILIPLAIPELRLMLALKKHYGKVLSPRYEVLAVQLQNPSAAQAKRALGAQMEPEQQTLERNSTAEKSLSNGSVWPLLGEVKYDDEEQINDAYVTETNTEKRTNFSTILHSLTGAENRDDIGRALIAYLTMNFPDCGIFVVREKTASGWLASTDNHDHPFDQLQIPLAEDSVFGTIARNHRHFLGQLKATALNLKILDYFHSQPSQNTLVLPINVQDRLVSILYVQGPLETLERHLAALQQIAVKTEMAFKLLILKNKILSL